ncbi:MAG: iron uptake porin [Cyanobium sp.]
MSASVRPKLLGLFALAGCLQPLAAFSVDGPQAALRSYADIAARNQVGSISQFNDVRPSDWAYQALRYLVERYGCVAGYADGTFSGGRQISRYEAAALLNACLDRVSEVTDELKRLMKEFEKELALLRGRVNGLEARVGELEATQFSTTTKLSGVAVFVIGANAFNSSERSLQDEARRLQGGTSFNYDFELYLDSSFTGKDLLHVILRAGNFADSAFGGGDLNELDAAFQQDCGEKADCGDVLAVNKFYYQWPLGRQFVATVGPKVGQEDMLAVWPSVYSSDLILNLFGFAGAPVAYNKKIVVLALVFSGKVRC